MASFELPSQHNSVFHLTLSAAPPPGLAVPHSLSAVERSPIWIWKREDLSEEMEMLLGCSIKPVNTCINPLHCRRCQVPRLTCCRLVQQRVKGAQTLDWGQHSVSLFSHNDVVLNNTTGPGFWILPTYRGYTRQEARCMCQAEYWILRELPGFAYL